MTTTDRTDADDATTVVTKPDVRDELADYPDPRPIGDVMADAVAANEAAGIPDPYPMNHTSDGTDESEEYDSW